MKVVTKRFFRVVLPLTLMGLVILASYTYCHRENKDQVLIQLISQILNSAHFSPQKMDDEFSEKVYNLYIKRMDYSKRFFTKENLAALDQYKLKVDDEIKASNFDFFEAVNTAFKVQFTLVQGYYREFLSKPFDLNVAENYEADADKSGFAANNEELKEIWRKTLKYQVLIRIDDMMDQSAKKTGESGNSDQITDQNEKKSLDTAKLKTFAEMEQEARKKVLKYFDDWFKMIEKNDESDMMATYINAITSVYDPHTQYLPPSDKEAFDIRMTGQLEGIGAQLQESDGNIKILNIVPGSPSWLQGQLQPNDIILKVAQENQDPVDLFGMKIEDAVQLIRGKKGTKVTLTIRKYTNDSVFKVTLTRDVIILEETFAKSAIINKPGTNDKYGYIYLPSFYSDFNRNENGRNCADDVAIELEKLKKEKVKGIVFDLRSNGGGSLPDAVRLAGLFISKGPVVQVKARSGPTRILEDTDPAVQYDGPMVVLVNSMSASASEILAAAMQDYQRAIIIGTPSTFGKGTVQTVVQLDDQLPMGYQSIKPLGDLFVTIQKFYRINGGATQIKGVTPDIIVPDIYSSLELGEKEEDYYLPWTKIDPLTYSKWAGIKNFDAIVKKENSFVETDKDFLMLKDQSKTLKKLQDETIIPLKLEEYKKMEKSRKELTKRFDGLSKQLNGLTVQALPVDLEAAKADTSKQARMESWVKDLRKDLILKEAVNTVSEISSGK